MGRNTGASSEATEAECSALNIAVVLPNEENPVGPPPEDDTEEPPPPGVPGDPTTPTPIILDLDGRGLELTDLATTVPFDIDNDGYAEDVTWVEPEGDDAFLWLDIDGDGVANHGGELFGDATELPGSPRPEHGFDALAFYDQPAQGGDGDGAITPLDQVWIDLRLWVDQNANAMTEPGEVFTLADVAILEIDLRYRTTGRRDRNGNYLRYWSFFERLEPGGKVKKGKAFDVYLQVAEP